MRSNRTIVRAKLTGDAKIKVVMLWVAYTDTPHWRDVMWYNYHMWNRGDHWEGSIHGKLPDAPVVERDPEYGWLPRHWKPSQ